MKEQDVLTVSAVTARIKSLLEGDPALARVYVRGEISNFKAHSSGHLYFTLKDEGAVLSAVMFRSDASKMKFAPNAGMKVIARGRVSLFAKSGQYQMYVDAMIPDGVGELYVAYEQLLNKLREEGLFEPSLKKPLPRFPNRIALVTSPTGAAVRDMLRILGSRFPQAEIIVCPVQVQGETAPLQIAHMIGYVNQHRLADLIITGRGGGSIEDLWAFNDERVARAIAASQIPVISAVGHEPDVTIADHVADLRAATPSNAAELAVPDRLELLAAVSGYSVRLRNAVGKTVQALAGRLRALAEKPVLSSPTAYVDERRMTLLYHQHRLVAAAEKLVADASRRFTRNVSMLDAMSPLKVLSRGYSIVSAKSGNVVKDAAELKENDRVDIRFHKGGAACAVLEVTAGDRRFEREKKREQYGKEYL